MDRSGEERNANWRGESDRPAWNRERDEWQQSGNWRNRAGSEADRNAQRAAASGQPSPFRETWGNSDGLSESFYNRAMSPYEPAVGGLEVRESHWPPPQARGAAAPPGAGWPDAAPRSAASAAAEAQRDYGRDDRWARQQGWWGNAPPSWSNRHAGIADTTWGGGGRMSQRERDWGENGSSWSRGAGAREWGTQPDWLYPAAEGPFRGRGPQGYRRSDERIREDICDLLTERGDVDPSAVQVRVQNCEVTLEGAVPDRRMKRVAEDIAEATRGVRDVHNRLRVASDLEDARSWRDDEAGARASAAGNRSAEGRNEHAGRGQASDRSASRASNRSSAGNRSDAASRTRSSASGSALESRSRTGKRSAPGRSAPNSQSSRDRQQGAGRGSSRRGNRER